MTSADVDIETTEIMDGPMGRHGYTRTPRSRVVAAREDPSLGAHVPEPQSIERPKGFPAYSPGSQDPTKQPIIPPDDQLFSGGLVKYRDLDGAVSPSGKQWPAMRVTPGGTLRMTWWLTARHKTQKWHYYITKDGAAHESQPLTRAMLEPLCTCWWHTGPEGEGWRAPFPISDVQHWIKLPRKQGRHIIYAVWDVADTSNAFYQGIDVHFAPKTGEDAPA